MQHSQHCLQIQLPWQLPALPALGLLVVLLPLLNWIPHHPSKIVVKSKRPEYPELSVQEALREIFTQISHRREMSFSFPFWNTILLKELTYIWAESFAKKRCAPVTPSTTNFAIFCLLQCRNTLYTKRCQNDLKSNEILQLPSGWFWLHSDLWSTLKWILRNDYWTTTCSILSYSTSSDAAASAAAGLATAGFGATFCGSSSSESSSSSQNCCKIQCIQNCQFRTPREELVYRIQCPFPKQQHFGFIRQTL